VKGGDEELRSQLFLAITTEIGHAKAFQRTSSCHLRVGHQGHPDKVCDQISMASSTP